MAKDVINIDPATSNALRRVEVGERFLYGAIVLGRCNNNQRLA